ncbi:MAG: transglutaminase-like domain-containing protein [Pirellulales bacterium]
MIESFFVSSDKVMADRVEHCPGADISIHRREIGNDRVSIAGFLLLKALIPVTATVKARLASRTIAAIPGDASSAELCLAATPRWPVNSPRIRSLAAEITSDATTDVSKVEMLLNWISDSRHFRFGGDVTGSRYGTLKALEQGYGHCWDYSDVFISLARASGVPARQVHGWLYESEGHIWPEVYIDGQWIAVDPTVGLRCGSDYIPFATSIDGETTYMLASEVKIKRTDASH